MIDQRRLDRVGPQEISILIVFVALSHMLWLNGNQLFNSPGQSAWISALASFIGGLAIALGVMRFVRGRGLVGALTYSFGNVLGSLLALLFAAYFLLMASATLGRVVLELAYYNYTAVNKPVMQAVFAIAMLVIACCGIAGVSRTARFGIVLVAVLIVLMLLFSSERLQPARLFPLMGEGEGATGRAALEMTGFYWSIFAIGALSRHTGNHPRLKRSAVLGVAVSAVALAVLLATMSAAADSPIYKYMSSPVLYLASLTKAGKFMPSMDSLFVCAWITLCILTGAFGLQCSAQILSRVSGTKTTKPFCVVLAGLMMALGSWMQIWEKAAELLKLAWIPALAIVLAGILIMQARGKNEV